MKILSEEHYAGWEITEFEIQAVFHPQTGTWGPVSHFAASRHGVSINTNTKEGIKRMINTKNYQISCNTL